VNPRLPIGAQIAYTGFVPFSKSYKAGSKVFTRYPE